MWCNTPRTEINEAKVPQQGRQSHGSGPGCAPQVSGSPPGVKQPRRVPPTKVSTPHLSTLLRGGRRPLRRLLAFWRGRYPCCGSPTGTSRILQSSLHHCTLFSTLVNQQAPPSRREGTAAEGPIPCHSAALSSSSPLRLTFGNAVCHGLSKSQAANQFITINVPRKTAAVSNPAPPARASGSGARC